MEKWREGELLPELTTGWPSESDGAKRSEGGRKEKKRVEKTCFYEHERLMWSAIVLRNHTRFATLSVSQAVGGVWVRTCKLAFSAVP